MQSGGDQADVPGEGRDLAGVVLALAHQPPVTGATSRANRWNGDNTTEWMLRERSACNAASSQAPAGVRMAAYFAVLRARILVTAIR